MGDDQGPEVLKGEAPPHPAASESVNAIDVLAWQHRELHRALALVGDPGANRVAAWLEAVRLMATHVAVERTFVYPVVKRRRLGSPELANQLRRDYARMEHLLVLTERRKINSPDMPDLVAEVLDAFNAHEDRCSTDLIPGLEKLGEQELAALGTKMQGAGRVILSHPHPHLLALGPVYQLTTRMAARWDQLRDRTVSNR